MVAGAADDRRPGLRGRTVCGAAVIGLARAVRGGPRRMAAAVHYQGAPQVWDALGRDSAVLGDLLDLHVGAVRVAGGGGRVHLLVGTDARVRGADCASHQTARYAATVPGAVGVVRDLPGNGAANGHHPVRGVADGAGRGHRCDVPVVRGRHPGAAHLSALEVVHQKDRQAEPVVVDDLVIWSEQ